MVTWVGEDNAQPINKTKIHQNKAQTQEIESKNPHHVLITKDKTWSMSIWIPTKNQNKTRQLLQDPDTSLQTHTTRHIVLCVLR